jgi:glutathione-regulated potassium-efflux system ancillary protein KefG
VGTAITPRGGQLASLVLGRAAEGQPVVACCAETAAEGVFEDLAWDYRKAGVGGEGMQPSVDFPRLSGVGRRVDTDDLIGAAEVAVILGLSHPSSATTYLRRYPDFPRPVVDLSASRVRLWRRQDVERWHKSRTAPA